MKQIVIILLMGLSFTCQAEFDVSSMVEVKPERSSLVNSDELLPNQVKTMPKSKLPTASERNKVKDFNFNKSQLLRCWQYGELIVAENGYANPSSLGQAIVSKGSQKLTGFNFGDTFCLYMGN